MATGAGKEKCMQSFNKQANKQIDTPHSQICHCQIWDFIHTELQGYPIYSLSVLLCINLKHSIWLCY